MWGCRGGIPQADQRGQRKGSSPLELPITTFNLSSFCICVVCYLFQTLQNKTSRERSSFIRKVEMSVLKLTVYKYDPEVVGFFKNPRCMAPYPQSRWLCPEAMKPEMYSYPLE
ncbi:UNVERIFIED_CONTAM: hypothetical protein K2H54_042562 [Gekko kuhli]